jgi:predicted transposase YdaD
MELKAFEPARHMKYVTTIERMAEERGEARGEARGEEKGARSREAEIALNMLHKNMSLETIAEVTGMRIEQIQALQTQAIQ